MKSRKIQRKKEKKIANERGRWNIREISLTEADIGRDLKRSEKIYNSKETNGNEEKEKEKKEREI